VAGLATAFGSGSMTNSIDEFLVSDVILATGTNTTENHPVISTKIKQAVVHNGAKLIVVDPRNIELTKFATLYLSPIPGTDVAWINGMMNIIIEEGLLDKKYIEERTENFEEMAKVVKKYTPEFVEGITGIPKNLLIDAARLYAKAKVASIVYAMGITQHTTGTDNVKSLANLAMLCGNVGKEGGGVNPLRGQANVQGACDLGALPNVYTGYQPVTNEEIRKKFEEAWKPLNPLPNKVGLTLTEMVDAIVSKKVKGVFLIGENPMLSDPDSTHVEKAIKELEFIAVSDIFLSETAKLADVVFPAVTIAEKDGTFTNTERRVQRVRKAIPPVGEAKPDWEIVSLLSTKMGYKMDYKDPEEIFEEIRTVTPSYYGITYKRIDEMDGIQWPCPSLDHPGTKYLHKDKFARGKGLFSAIEFIKPAELPDDEYPFILSTGRVLFHYHTATMTRRSKGINEYYPKGYVEINPVDAEKLGVKDEDLVKVKSRRGEIQINASVTDRSPIGTIFIPFHFYEAKANILTNPALDPIAKIPEYKVCAVQVERVEE